jgi:uncharacterized membrane protein YgaE (UPF0421/DUF939 family)
MLRKLALSLLALVVGVLIFIVIAYSFGLGSTVQNSLMIVNALLAALWLYFTWRGRWVLALSGIMATFVVGVFIIPLLAR